MPRAVRRRAGARGTGLPALPALAPTLLVLALAGTASGCGGVGQPATYDPRGVDGLLVPTPSPDPADFVDEVDNPWLALETVGRWRYRVERDGARVGSLEVEALGGHVEVAGLRATGVRTVALTEGKDAEVSVVTRYYAQDASGNVWLVGESAPGRSWRAGEAGALAGLAMPADPRFGDGWVRALVPGSPEEAVRVVDPPAVVPDGAGGAVWIAQSAPTPSRQAYVAGLGMVVAEELDTGETIELVSPAPG